MEMLNRMAGISLVHVPYKSGAPAVIDTVSGQIHMVVTAIPAVMAQLKASRLRALAVTSSRRSPALPDVPAIAESGLSNFDSVTWYAVYAPGKTPGKVTERLFGEIRAAASNPGVRSTAAQEGFDLDVKGPQQLAGLQAADTARWRKTIREAGISLE
jgi:tripartite-type tricarboxylate transporter receptor subunit TctC